MTEKEFEPCTLEQATHVEMGGVVYHIGDNATVIKFMDFISDKSPMIRVTGAALYEFIYISEISFPIFGIQPLKEKKQEPIEFEATFVKHDGEWHRLFSLHGLKHVGCREAKFRCVQILEEEK